MTDPAGTVVLDCCVIVPTTRFAFVIAVVAAVCVRPTTFGTATCGGPDETTRFTELPVATCVPDTGDWLITRPAATVVLDCCVTVPTTRPAFVIAVDAAVCVRPTTLGTATCGGPDETTRFTELPTVTCVAAVGDWLITEPAGTVVLDCCVTVPTTRPALVIAVDAAVCVRPTTFGTATCGGPDDTTRFTELPTVACVPDTGDWLITEPAGTVVLDCCVSVPTARFAVVIAAVAAVCVRPTTFGTATCGGPDDTTRFTELPTVTWVAAAGVWLITEPAATVVLDCCVTVPTTRFAFVIAVVAAVCVRPTTFGTATCGGPDDTTRFTELPTVTWVAAAGVWLMTEPAGTVVLDCCVIVPTTRPAFVIAVVAAVCVRPTTFG